MSAKSVVTAVTGFLSHHVGDLSAIHVALSELVSVAPIDSQDKDRINSVLSTIENSAKNVEAFLSGNKLTGGDVVVKESDLVKAVADYLTSDAGQAVLLAAVKSTEGNANG
jgi:hypothetical protein